METNHKFGLYNPSGEIRTFVMDDFGNAIELKGDTFMQAVDFIVSIVGTDH